MSTAYCQFGVVFAIVYSVLSTAHSVLSTAHSVLPRLETSVISGAVWLGRRPPHRVHCSDASRLARRQKSDGFLFPLRETQSLQIGVPQSEPWTMDNAKVLRARTSQLPLYLHPTQRNGTSGRHRSQAPDNNNHGCVFSLVRFNNCPARFATPSVLHTAASTTSIALADSALSAGTSKQ